MWSSNLTSTIRTGPGWPRSKDQQENEPPASPRDNLPKVSRTCICGMGEACKALSIAFAAFKEDPRGKFVVVPQAKYEAFWTNVRPKQEVDLASYTDPCYIGAHHFEPEVLQRCQAHGQQEDLLLLPTVTKMWHEEALPNYAFDRAHQDLRQAMRQHLKEVEAQSKQKRELRKSRRQEMLQIAAKRMSKSRRTSKSRVTPLVVVQDNDNQKVMVAKSVGSGAAKTQQQRQQQSLAPPAISPASSFRIEMKPTFETAQEGEIELFLDTDEEREAEIEKAKAEKERETQSEGPKPKQPPKRKVSCPAKEVKGAPAFTPRARTPQPPGLGDGECIEVVLEEIFARNVNFFDDISSSRLQGSHQQQLNTSAHHVTYSPERRVTPTEDPPAKAATLATDPPGIMDGSSARQRDSTASARHGMDGSEKHQPFQPRALPSFRPISPTPPTQDKPKVKLQSMDMPFVPVVETVGSSDLESSSHHARSPTLASVKTAPSLPTPESQTPSEPTPKAGNPFVGNFFDEGMAAHDSASQFGNPFDQVVADTANPFATAAKAQPSPFDTATPNPFDTERVIRSAPSTGAETFATAGGDTFATATDPFDDTPLSPTKSVQSNPFAATSPPNPFDSAGANETADAAAAAAALGVFEDFPTKVLQPTASFAERVFEDSVQGQHVAKKQQEEEFLVQPRSKEPASSELPLTPTMSALEDEAEEEDPSVSELKGEFLMPDPPAAEPSEREEEKEEIEAFKSADQEDMEEEALMRDTVPEPIVASQSYDTCEEEEKENEIVVQPMTTGEMARSIATADSSGIVSVPLTPIRGSEHAPEGAPRSAFATPLHETPARASAFMTPQQTAEKTPKSAPRALFGPGDTKGLFSGEKEDANPQPAGLGGFREGEEPVEDDFRNLLRASHVVVQSSDQSSNLDSSGQQDDIDLGDVSSTAGDEHSMDSKPKMIFVSQAESEKAARGELEVEPSICNHNNPRNIVIFYGCMFLLAVGNIHYGNVLKERRILEKEMAALETPPVPVSLEEPTAAPWASTEGGEEVNPLADVDMEPESEVLAPEMADEATPIEGDSETKPAKSSWFWRSSPAPAPSEEGEKATTGAVADQDSAVDEADSETKTDILPEENTEAGSPSENVEVPTPKSSWFWRSSPTSSPGDATLVDDKALFDDIGDSAPDSGELTSADASAENIETEVSGSVANPSLEVPTDQAPKKKSSSWFWRSSSQADIAGSDTSTEEVETTMDVSSPEAAEEAGSGQTESRKKEGNLQESMDSASGTADGQSSDRNVQIDELPGGAQTKKKSSWFSWRSSEDSSADKPLGSGEKTDASGGTEDIDSSKAEAEIERGMDSVNGELPLSKENDDIGASHDMNTSDNLEQGNPAPPIKEEKKPSWFWSTSPSSSPTSESHTTTSSIEEDTIAEKTAVTPEEDTAASTSAISDAGTEQETLEVEVDGTADPQVEGESTNTRDGGNPMIEDSTTAEKGGKSSWWWGKSAPTAPTDGEGLGSEGSDIDVLGAEQDVALPDGSSVEVDEMARSKEIEGSGAAVSEPADPAEINSLEEEHTNQTAAGAVEDADGTQGQDVEDEDQTKKSASEEGKESSSSWFWGRSSPKATKINTDESLDSSSSTDAKDHIMGESSSSAKDTDQGDDDASTKKSRSDANATEEDIKSTNAEESSSAATSSDSMETLEVTSGPNVDQVKSTANDTAESKKSRSIWASRDSSEEPTHEVIDLDSSSDEAEEVTSSGQDEKSGDTAEEANVEHGKQKDSLSVNGDGTRREDKQEDLQSTAGDGAKVPANGDESDGALAEDIQSGEASSTETPNLDVTSDNKTDTIDAEELVKLQGDDISVADSLETTPAEKQSSWIWRKLGMASSGDDAVKQNEMAGITSSTTSSSGNVDIPEGTPAQSDAVSMETTEESIEGTLISQGNAAITTSGPMDLEESALRAVATESAGEQAAAEDHSDEKQQEEKATSWWQYFKSSEKKEKKPLTVDSAASDVSSDHAAGDVHGVELPDSSDGVSESLEEEVLSEERSHDSTKEDVEIHSGDQSLLGDNEDSVSAGPATLDSDELSDAPTAEPTGTPPTWQRVFKPTSAEKSDESILGDGPVEELNEDGPSNNEGFPVDSDQPDSGEDHQNLRGENTGENIKESDIEGLGDTKETSFGAQTEADTIKENEATPETEAAADTDQGSGMDQSEVLEPGAAETGESTGAWSLRGSLGSLASSAKSYIYSASKNEHLEGLEESSDTESNDDPAVVEEKASLGGEDVTSPDSEVATLEGEEATGDVTKDDSLAASEGADLTEKKEEADAAKVTGLPEEGAPKEESGWQWTNKLRKVVGLESESPSEDITMGKAPGEDSTDAQQQGEESVSEGVESVASGREVSEKTEEPGLPSAPSDVAGLNGESTAESVEPDLQEEMKEDSITEDDSSGAEESTAEGGEEPASTAGLWDKWKGMANSFADYAKYTKSAPPSDDKEAAVETPDVASEPDAAAPSDQEAVVDEDSMPTIEVEDTAGDESVDEDSSESDTVDEPNKETQKQELAQDTKQGEIDTDSSDTKETRLESETESETETTADSNDVVLEPMEAMPSDKTASADQGVKDTSSQQQVLGTVDDAASNKLKEFWIRAIVRWYNSGFALESVLLVLGAYFYWGRG